MRSLEGFPNIYLYSGVVDFRKQARGLAIIVEQVMKHSPLSEGSLFAFISRDKRKIRLLYWDQTGFALWWKELERDRFVLPKPRGDTLTLSNRDLELLLGGYDVFRMKPHEKVIYDRYS